MRPMAAIRLDDEPQSRLTAHDPRLETWRAFLRAHALLTRRLDEDLRSAEGLTLGEYSALLQVAEAPGRSLRMNQLATGIFLSRSGVTRLIDRLEADGLITRSTCTDDGRGALAVLTDAGLAQLKERMPHADFSEFEKDPNVSKMAELFKVQTIVNYVKTKVA